MSRRTPSGEPERPPAAALDAALGALLGSPLEAIVEMVLVSPERDTYEARAVDGALTFRRIPTGTGWTFETIRTEGRNPLGDQDPSRFSPLSEEMRCLHPAREVNSYPFAFEHVAQVFDHPCAPDVLVVHSSAHSYGGNIGQHGSPDVVQARAPLVLAGAGVRKLGMLSRHCRLVDVAPTILALLGVDPNPGIGANGSERPDAFLGRQDGEPLLDVVEPGRAQHVVVILLDGCNPNLLFDVAASGEAESIARLISAGSAFAHGAMASLPTVTLANHTTLLTGCHPGHHGILHNAWYDRDLGCEVVTESPEKWQEAMKWMRPGIETVHEALKRARPSSVSVSVNEAADRGADYSTFQLFRDGKAGLLVPDMSALPPHTTSSFAETNEKYGWWSFADTVALTQFRAIWEGRHLGARYPRPDFSWVSFSLTDSASHTGGPHSPIAAAALRDTDRRVGELIDAVERAGALEDTAFILLSDHGMEQSDPQVVGDWDETLRRAGLDFIDESSGFLYISA